MGLGLLVLLFEENDSDVRGYVGVRVYVRACVREYARGCVRARAGVRGYVSARECADVRGYVSARGYVNVRGYVSVLVG